MSDSSEVAGNTLVSSSDALSPDSRCFSLGGDAFLLDVDGTILDIAPTPETVTVPVSLVEALTLLRTRTGGAVALVSGRAIAVLDRLFAPLRLTTIGCHGAEWRQGTPGRVEERRPPLPEELRQISRQIAVDQPGLRLEDKGYTIAFHYRGVPEQGPALAERLQQLVAHSRELRLLYGKFVIELKAVDFNKGEAIEELMRIAPFATRRPVFLGDDTTDEDAFASVRALGGLGISVGRTMANAELMLPAPHDARHWLACLAGAGSPSSNPGRDEPAA